jgi:hypothetical protein
MSIDEAKNFLANRGMSSCSCNYGGFEGLVETAIRMKELEEENKKPTE